MGSGRAEEARAAMIELFPEGFEEVEFDGGVELAAYTGPGGEERLWGVFGPGEGRDVPGGWMDAWRRFHRPVRVGPLWVGPPWEDPDDGAVTVVVDPGRAFGTGGHATTRLSLELLLAVEPASVLDVGCGSGVLAIAAAKLGFSPVIAVDLEAAAVEATTANAALNAVEIEVRHADALTVTLPAAEVGLANIALEPLETLARHLPAQTLIASGYLAGERPALDGWRHVDRRDADGWAADLFERS